MFGDLLSSRAIQVGLVFFVLVVSGSLLYSWHVQRNTAAEWSRTPLAVESLENEKETSTARVVLETPEVRDTPEANEDTQSMFDETAAVPNETENLDITDAFLPDEIVSEETQVFEDVPVSPFGFGAYPEIPADFPFNVKWTDTTEHIDLELSARVMIKAWNEGERFLGSSIGENGRVYLHYPKTVYVQERKHIASDGSAGGSSRLIIGDIKELSPGESLPADIQVLDYNSAGIDPYEYLDLLLKEHAK